MKRKRIALLAVVLVVVAGGVAYWRLTSAPPAVPADAAEPPPVPAAPAPDETPEQKTRRQLVGVFQDEYKGKRTMTLKPDGTGTMLVELSGVQAMLFASKLRFDMKWSLKDKTLTKTTVGGEPADKVNLILNTMGNSADETILEVNDEHLLLLDKDGQTKYDWKRKKTDPPKP